MPHVLQQLLGRNDSLFVHALEKLERIVDDESVDARLVADIAHKAHDITRKLRLDPAHTVAVEIYNALRAHTQSDDRIQALLATDYVLYVYEDEVVSFNLLDLMDDIHEERGYVNRSLSHGRRALAAEMIHRYTAHSRTHDPTVRALLKQVETMVNANNDTNETPKK